MKPVDARTRISLKKILFATDFSSAAGAALPYALLRQLRDLVPPEAENWYEPNFVVEQRDAGEKILDVAKRYHADVVVLGIRHLKESIGATTHLARRTAHKVVVGAASPVLTVRG